jgi:hypothetical protein
MSNKIDKKHATCGNCENVRYGDMCGLKTAYCGFQMDDDGPIVPHHAELKNGNRGDPTIIIFWRVPMWCHRDDNEVIKSDSKAKESEWVYKELK